jgi:hypothetical protein
MARVAMVHRARRGAVAEIDDDVVLVTRQVAVERLVRRR